MKTQTANIQKNGTLYIEIKTLLQNARNRVYQTINTTMTETYWQIGKRIVEEEQNGHSRAEYGAGLIKNLSDELTIEFGKGFSVDNLENMRKFYLVYSKSETASRKFALSWSHYIFLTRINHEDERNFYEIEAMQNSWTLRELKDQDIGQMMMYVNYFDRVEKTEDENLTIGIILCKDKSKALVEMTLPKENRQIYASKYLTILPNKEELQKLLQEEINE
ncbi:MAG: hypothetical protein A2513_05405 [Sulfurimonas sp. RIFOXYD12_FULL_33_39]|uniref:PDDEXK nuclease domain-containing protein n=1 Tax=unclassified Sulfurimonas TaxID=2623549 RepID=UPI0008C87B54|nr:MULTISPECIES: PDDEXK nuclease domain-containing protein [unclassified Sulfurimonas]OHE04710.1 MAG: hypothetical protein A3G74_03360 [Sulfurimonas sp. RIFCSPLOWO2_12_FULL_34_6]OHE10308.1 MAG: hypothetical protein A2513_05405 [Sulfurimonas sp. RIFOXYD12_FULL_33_39]OHE13116.1 MAG: hypothetical protein A2530_11550 [Sulfurimonas sp. RIFOXYD2_FULL_34_21]DAB28743.1 MAG TPA: hypothetical protein CFH78_00865 [Sulfurimonas sp. UBA10385]